MSEELLILKKENERLLAIIAEAEHTMMKAASADTKEEANTIVSDWIDSKDVVNPIYEIQAKAIEDAIERTAEEFEMGFVCPIFSLKYLAKKVRNGEVKI